MKTFAAHSAQPPHRSLFLAELQRKAGGVPLDEWLVAQANARGYLGAYGPLSLDPEPHLAAEEILVALLMPHGLADGRLFKLVLRMIQSGRLDLPRLHLMAKRERADGVLWWLLERVPDEERGDEVRNLHRLIGGPPRGYRPLALDYDARRLVRRPFRGF